MNSTRALIVLFVAVLAGCGGKATTLPTTAAVCGNGVVETGEVCDEGTANGTMGGHCKSDCSGLPNKVSIEGDVLAFLTEVSGPRLDGVQVSILERSDLTLVAGADAHFRFDGLWEGDDVTLVASQSTIQTTQTSTWKLGPNGFLPLPIQVLPTNLYGILTGLLPLPPELDQTCAIATTVARMGGSLYAHQRQGMPDVTVTIDPPLDPSSGPIYFGTSAIPDTTITATTVDGGVLFYRVPPGNYVLKASKAGVVFNTVRINCRVGMVVNAAPPTGLIANVANPDFSAGVGRAADVYSASSDALCEETASCVNGTTSTTLYPPAMLSSCKSTYQNSWAWVEATCDATAKVRDAAKTFYDCRSASCAAALGDDTFCTAEDTAFRAAEAAYGSCLAAAN